MAKAEPTVEPEWDCSWEQTRRRQLSAGLAASPAQRLAWLEEAIALAHRSGALPRPRPNDSSASEATDSEGVDRTLIREVLALSPDERLHRLEQLVEMIQRVREANGFSALP